MPCSLAQAGLDDSPQMVRFLRRFGLPRLLDASEHIWLIVQPQAVHIDVMLNEHWLGQFGGPGPFAVECTTLLLERNLLEIILQARDDQDGLTGETYLEIRQGAYLQNPRAARLASGAVEVSVEVAGTAPENLDLYLMENHRTVGYSKPDEHEGTQVVTLKSDGGIAPESTNLRVELVHGGVVWYHLDCSVT
jgi:hypothetical protein